MSRASAAAEASASAGGVSAVGLAGYLGRSAQPLTSLVFLLPFIVLYELGTRFLLTDPVQGTQHIVAFTMMQRFFAFFGAYGQFLPAAAVIAILIAWHVARRDAWTINLPTLVGMVVESLCLALPLIVIDRLIVHMPALAAPAVVPSETRTEGFILSLGAGVYEEMVFRLMLCTTLAMALKNGLKLNQRLSTLLLVVGSATLFSAYHYLGPETFQWRIFVFRLTAGIYFGGLFLARGFGVTAGSHMAYDILIVTP